MSPDKILKIHLCVLCIISKKKIKYLLTYSTTPKKQGKINNLAMLFLAVFAFWAQKWPKNRSKYKIWIFEYPRESVEVVKPGQYINYISWNFLLQCWKKQYKSTILKKGFWQFFGLLSSYLDQIWSKNRSKHKIWIPRRSG